MATEYPSDTKITTSLSYQIGGDFSEQISGKNIVAFFKHRFQMRTAVSENGFAVNCRFNGFLFTLETVYHREQELMTESYDPQTGMLKVEVKFFL